MSAVQGECCDLLYCLGLLLVGNRGSHSTRALRHLATQRGLGSEGLVRGRGSEGLVRGLGTEGSGK